MIFHTVFIKYLKVYTLSGICFLPLRSQAFIYIWTVFTVSYLALVFMTFIPV